MRRILVLILSVLLVAMLAYAKDKEEERLENCATVMQEILNVPENIPQDLLDKAECIGVIPSVKKFALGFGGSYGAGAFICRSGLRFDGPGAPPPPYPLGGGGPG